MMNQFLPAFLEVKKNQLRKGIGFFGGSFDPVHLGHLAVLESVYHAIPLEEILVVPCFLSPFKNKTFYSDKERLVRLKRALKPYFYCRIWEYEMKRAEISYTYDTIIYLKKRDDRPISLIMGLDSFLTFPKWYRANALLEEVNYLIVVKRPGVKWTFEARNLLANQNKKIFWLDVPTPDLASHRLRK